MHTIPRPTTPDPRPTTPGPRPGTPEFRMVVVDLYRDIHKGIRSELTSLVEAAGSIDPHSRGDRLAVSDHVASVSALLASHAEHEDSAILPTLERELPDLAARIESDHHELERRFDLVVEQSLEFTADTADARRRGQLLYLDLARFVSDYFVHIDVEERELMPRLEDAVGVDAVAEMHAAIVGSIPPDEMMRSLSIMLPAMNADDRAELLSGMRLGAPPEAFAAVVDLARALLRPDQFRSLSDRLELS